MRMFGSRPESLHLLLNHVSSMRYHPCTVCPVSKTPKPLRVALTQANRIKSLKQRITGPDSGVPGLGGILSTHVTSKYMPVKLPSPSLASAHGNGLHSSPFVALLSRTTCIAEADATAQHEITLFLVWTAARFVKDQCTRFCTSFTCATHQSKEAFSCDVARVNGTRSRTPVSVRQ